MKRVPAGPVRCGTDASAQVGGWFGASASHCAAPTRSRPCRRYSETFMAETLAERGPSALHRQIVANIASANGVRWLDSAPLDVQDWCLRGSADRWRFTERGWNIGELARGDEGAGADAA